MKEHRKNITSGDILEMMVQAGLKPATELKRERREPIVSINGKDVDWGKNGGNDNARRKKEAA